MIYPRFAGSPGPLLGVSDLLARGKLRTQELITHRFPLDRINEAFETAQDRRRTGAIFVGLEI